MDKCRVVALNVLNGVTGEGAYSNILLSKSINESDLIEKDRALVTEIVYGTLKYKYTIDKILMFFINRDLNKLDISVLNILRASIYQIKYLTKVPEFAVVNEAVDIIKKINGIGASKFINGVLRNYLRQKDANFAGKSEIEKICFDYSFLPWMAELFIKQYGREKAMEIMQGSNEVPTVSARVNVLKASYDKAIERLREDGFSVEEGYASPEAITIIKGKNIENNKSFVSGYITVQDESAMLVAPSMELTDDMIVFDMCSAPGGKTTHISEIMNNTGKVTAFDIHKNKLRLIGSNAGRLGITNIKLAEMDSSKYDEKFYEAAHRVLIDVPCSGLGLIRKKPEIKWTKSERNLQDILKLQRDIMETSAKYVKINGILMYSTCTLNKEENEDNINWFLNRYKDFEIEPLYFGKAPNIMYNESGWVTIMPNKYMDGFFICKLKKHGRC